MRIDYLKTLVIFVALVSNVTTNINNLKAATSEVFLSKTTLEHQYSDDSRIFKFMIKKARIYKFYTEDEIIIEPFPSIHNFFDMTGMRIEKLTVIGYAGSKYKAAQWWCKCDCGRLKMISRPSLRAALRGDTTGTRSCGCVRATGEGSRPDYICYRKNLNMMETSMNKAFMVYLKAAQKRGLEWALSKEDFHNIVSKNCHYCGEVPMMFKSSTSIHSPNKVYFHNGIDRVDNSKGYILSNCLPCCSICNHAKCDMSYNDFIKWVNKTSKHLNAPKILPNEFKMQKTLFI